MTDTTKEFVCSDCGADLLEDDFISSVCPECGGLNPMTRQDYREYADAQDPTHADNEGNTRLVVSSGVEGVVLTDGDSWLQCKEPADTQANL